MGEFVGREIEVVTGGEVKAPVSFRLGEREYRVAEVLEAWQDHGFGLAQPLRKNWRLRHHRSYYRVRTSEGEVFEIYFERGWAPAGAPPKHPQRRRWYVYRKLRGPTSQRMRQTDKRMEEQWLPSAYPLSCPL